MSDLYSGGAWFKSWLGKVSWLKFYMIFSVPPGWERNLILVSDHFHIICNLIIIIVFDAM